MLNEARSATQPPTTAQARGNQRANGRQRERREQRSVKRTPNELERDTVTRGIKQGERPGSADWQAGRLAGWLAVRRGQSPLLTSSWLDEAQHFAVEDCQLVHVRGLEVRGGLFLLYRDERTCARVRAWWCRTE